MGRGNPAALPFHASRYRAPNSLACGSSFEMTFFIKEVLQQIDSLNVFCFFFFSLAARDAGDKLAVRCCAAASSVFPQGNQVLTLYSHFPCDHCSSLKSLSCVAGCWVCREVGSRLRQSKQSIRYNSASLGCKALQEGCWQWGVRKEKGKLLLEAFCTDSAQTHECFQAGDTSVPLFLLVSKHPRKTVAREALW